MNGGWEALGESWPLALQPVKPSGIRENIIAAARRKLFE
jgi:hypothetical protein